MPCRRDVGVAPRRRELPVSGLGPLSDVGSRLHQPVMLGEGNLGRRGGGDPLDWEVLLDVLVGQFVEVQRVPLHAEQFLDSLVAGQPLQGEEWVDGSGVPVSTRGYQRYGAVIPLAITHSPPGSNLMLQTGEERQAIEERPPDETRSVHARVPDVVLWVNRRRPSAPPPVTAGSGRKQSHRFGSAAKSERSRAG
jgi:hypothetical protein